MILHKTELVRHIMLILSMLLYFPLMGGCSMRYSTSHPHLKNKSYHIYYDSFALRATNRPYPPTGKNRFIVAIRSNHISIKSFIRTSKTLDKVFSGIKRTGCSLDPVNDSVAVYIVERDLSEEPLLIYKEGIVEYKGHKCYLQKGESDSILREIGLQAYWMNNQSSLTLIP